MTDNSVSANNSTTNFRNVSACNRCRNRKNRCDQKLPRCSGCEKVNVKCVGFDPVSKRQIPRSYVYYLETRVNNLESILRERNIPCPAPSEDFSISESIKPGINVPFPALEDGPKSRKRHNSASSDEEMQDDESTLDPTLHVDETDRKIKPERRQGNSDLKAPGGLSHIRKINTGTAIPFSRVVLAAVKSSVNQATSERSEPVTGQPPHPLSSGGNAGGSSSFFALHTKPAAEPAPFPEQSVGQRLVDLYFEYANPQIPILHRPEFTALFEKVYATESGRRTPRELYLLNMVFAIGAGIIMDSSNDTPTLTTETSSESANSNGRKRVRLLSRQHQPEEYHAAAIIHLDNFLGTSPAATGVGGGLEELQAVLLLAGLALLRPFAPGLWYIIGVAVRLAVDLGLHCEEHEPDLDQTAYGVEDTKSRSKGRRQWTRDLRRRLWWCTFSLDRLVSTCVGRPIGITEQVVTTAFPSLHNDEYITTGGFLKPPHDELEGPSYKLVARHYFRLRLLQSEILQVLQYRQAEQTRIEQATNEEYGSKIDPYMRTDLPSPFLVGFASFRDWRIDVDQRLWKWKESAPKQSALGVAFTPLFLELNYWQAIITLYRNSLAVPEQLAEELSPATGDMASPSTAEPEAKEDEQMVFMKVAQAGQTVLKIYRQLHRLKLVNYTFLATHHLFMSGISFLYAIWHSELVRSQVTLDDVDFTVLIATSVLGDMIAKCPPAEACRDAFVRMSKATISMVINTTGFGNISTLGSQPLNSPGGYFSNMSFPSTGSPHSTVSAPSRIIPKFDMNLRDLFTDEEIASRPFNLGFERAQRIHDLAANTRSITSRPFHSNSSASERPTIEFERQQAMSVSPPLQHQVLNRYQSLDQNHVPSSYGLGDGLNYLAPMENYTDIYSQPDLMDHDFWSQVNALSSQNDVELGFGTGGFDGAWEANGGVDLFDGMFFGNSGTNNTNGNGPMFE